jgi:regulator of sigma E protease
MAKYFGVRVRVFSIGFGKKLFTVRRGGTEYCLSVIPFGGYVAMAGENPDEKNDTSKPDDFSAQPIRARAAIAFGGPAVNVIFAVLILFVLYMVGVQEPITDRLIVGFVEENSPGSLVGIVPGDTIISLDGAPIKGWDKFREEVGTRIGAPVKLSIASADGKRNERIVIPQELRDLGIGWAGIHPRHRVIVAMEPEPSSAAGSAGIHQGDTILSVSGVFVTTHKDVVDPINLSKGKPVEVKTLRGADTLSFMISPRYNESEKRYMVGIQMGLFAMNETVLVRRGPIAAGIKSLQTSWQLATSIFRYLGRMVQGQVKPKALSGPVGIVPIIGLSWLESFQTFLMMLALISVNLGVMNLLPLAITDGAILMFLGLEALRGRPLSRKLQAQIQQVATFVFIGLFVYLTFQDLSRITMFLR